MATTKQQKRNAALASVDEVFDRIDFSREKVILGIGSGSTIVPVVPYLKKKLEEKKIAINKVICIPTSFQAKQLIIDIGLNLGTLEQYPEIDIAIDGADEVDEKLNLIKGGGGCHTMEKLVAYASASLFIVCDESKVSKNLFQNWTKGLPIEVLPESYSIVMKAINKFFPDVKFTIRHAAKKAGPVITDSGNFIIDIFFNEVTDLEKTESQLISIPGVVCTGFFINMAEKIFVGKSDGSVSVF